MLIQIIPSASISAIGDALSHLRFLFQLRKLEGSVSDAIPFTKVAWRRRHEIVGLGGQVETLQRFKGDK